jgi:hypothetical protein
MMVFCRNSFYLTKVEYAVVAVFVVDFLLKTNVAYYDPETGVLKTKQPALLWNYMRRFVAPEACEELVAGACCPLSLNMATCRLLRASASHLRHAHVSLRAAPSSSSTSWAAFPMTRLPWPSRRVPAAASS